MPGLVKGNMQLFSVDQQSSRALEAHAASFASIRVGGNESPILISFATKAYNAGQVIANLHVMELGAQPGKPSFTEKQADLLFPPGFAKDFPIAMQISHKYHLIYVITKLGLLFVYDLKTATAVYRNRISPDPIFLVAEVSSVGGFYAINGSGQVLLATVNEQTIVSFVSSQVGSQFGLPNKIRQLPKLVDAKQKIEINLLKLKGKLKEMKNLEDDDEAAFKKETKEMIGELESQIEDWENEFPDQVVAIKERLITNDVTNKLVEEQKNDVINMLVEEQKEREEVLHRIRQLR